MFMTVDWLLSYLHFKYSDIYKSMADTEKKYHLDNVDLKEAFEMFDADDDGEITLEELGKV